MDNYKMSSNIIELSEHKTYIELTRRLCYYDYPNLNGVQLNSDDASEKAETLLNQPVVAKYKKIANKDDLGGHECSVDMQGNVTFNTIPIGVNTAVEVKNDTVSINGETVDTPCLFAKSRIWTRNKNICSAVKRLFAERLLHSSWEILAENDEFVNGVKILKDYMFESDCLLGSRTQPAYGNCATTLCVASSENPELLMSEAIAKDFDILNIEQKEETNLKKSTQEVAEEEVIETPTETSEENVEETTPNADEVSEDENSECKDKKEKSETENDDKEENDDSDKKEDKEVSELTEYDLRSKINEEVRKVVKWGWVCYMFPADSYVLVKDDDATSELEYLKFTYTVSDDIVTLGEPETVKLVVSVAEINTKIAEKDDAIVSANAEIQTLKAEIETLATYKERCEKEDAEKAENEIAEKQNSLRQYALDSKQITKAELETEEFMTIISELDGVKLKSIISDRCVASLTKKNSKVETSEVEVSEKPKANIDTVEDVTDYRSAIKSFLGK